MAAMTTPVPRSVEEDETGETFALLPAEPAAEHADRVPPVPLDRGAVACLLLQHLSSTINDACYNFAVFLFLIEVFKDTLVPASLVGLATTAAGLALSARIGAAVDTTARLPFVRRAILGQKATAYTLFLVLFGPIGAHAQAAFHGHAPAPLVGAVWLVLAAMVACSCVVSMANTGLNLAVERDWVSTIAGADSAHLTTLNTYMRRIDLLSKLAAPLLVSLLTTTTSYLAATAILLGLAVATAASETLWIAVVHARFPALAQEAGGGDGADRAGLSVEGRPPTWRQWLAREADDWREFARLPVFWSSLSIGTIYLTTLSYDGTFIAYVKAARGYDDGFIALMRAVCLVTGLIGTALMPVLERRLGLERAGAWSIWSQALCLAPAVYAFFCPAAAYGAPGPAWNAALLFGGIALSRVGLWSFDLCQLKALQRALADHARPGRLAARQLVLQHAFDMLKYALTLAAATPAQFKWTALVSWAAVLAGATTYAVFLRQTRGHLVHLGWISKVC